MEKAVRLNCKPAWQSGTRYACVSEWIHMCNVCAFARFTPYMAYFARFPKHIPHLVVYVSEQYTTYCHISHTYHNMVCLTLCIPQSVDHDTHVAACILRESSTHTHQNAPLNAHNGLIRALCTRTLTLPLTIPPVL